MSTGNSTTNVRQSILVLRTIVEGFYLLFHSPLESRVFRSLLIVSASSYTRSSQWLIR